VSRTAKPRNRRRHPVEEFNLPEHELRARLIAGSHRRTLSAYLGATLYRELRTLARRAASASVVSGKRAYVLPGIMGSRLGAPARSGSPEQVIWIDPLSIESGRLAQLALPGRRPLRSLGVQLFKYLKLKLALENAGYQVHFHDYDWRQSVDVLGRELLARLRTERAPSVAVIAHSMGGLVARAAMKADRERRIARLLMLATPNYGSYAPVLALRGAYPPVRRIARLDHLHDADAHAQRIFATFPGLYQLLPAAERLGAVNLYDTAAWPRDVRAPRRALLDRARAYREKLAEPDARCTLIVGTDQPTITGLVQQDGAFLYQITNAGDGTVPTELALLDGVDTYFVRDDHSELAHNSVVVAAVLDLLERGKTRKLARHASHRATAPLVLTEREFRADDASKHDWRQMTLAERHHLLAGVVFPMLV
jgi:pimeloyl-ACP methyl ester carboxylesterase